MKKNNKRKAYSYGIIIIGVISLFMLGLFIIRRINSKDLELNENIIITSNAFVDGGIIPVKYTGKGENVSPDMKLSDVTPEAKSIAIIMDDLDFPLGIYNHWVMWNLPVQDYIPEGIPCGPIVNSMQNAVQGKGYGVNRYKGPNPPFGTHRYQYKVYVLDTLIDLDSDSNKKELLEQMDGHVLQYGKITGKFK